MSNRTGMDFRSDAGKVPVHPGKRAKHVALVVVDGNLGRGYVAGSASIYFNEAEDVSVPADEVDIAAQLWRRPSPGDDGHSPAPQLEQCGTLSAQAGQQMLGCGLAFTDADAIAGPASVPGRRSIAVRAFLSAPCTRMITPLTRPCGPDTLFKFGDAASVFGCTAG